MVDYPVGYCKPPIEHRFKKGEGGRKAGSRNKLGEDFINALAEDFAKHGAAVIAKVRPEKSDAYLKVVASLLPKDVNLNVNKYENLTDKELVLRLRLVTEEARPLLGQLLEAENVDEPESEACSHSRAAGPSRG
jgi:hypothetical protein